MTAKKPAGSILKERAYIDASEDYIHGRINVAEYQRRAKHNRTKYRVAARTLAHIKRDQSLFRWFTHSDKHATS